MDKKYTQADCDKIRVGQDVAENGAVITYKRLPHTDDPGGVDPQVLKSARKMTFSMKLLPKKQIAGMFSNLATLRLIFNGVKSIPVTREDMRIENLTVPGEGGDIPIRLYFPAGEARGLPVFFYMHGGGGFAGSPDVVEQACKMITDMHPCLTVSVDYRLAPENPFPAGPEDCWSALKWVYAHIAEYGGDPKRIAVSGDSFGGNMSLYCALRDREEKTGMVKLVVPFYPCANASNAEDEFYKTPTLEMFEINDKYKKFINPMMMGAMLDNPSIWQDADPSSTWLSPYLADLTGLPPMLILAGSHDYLMPGCKALAMKLSKADVPVRTVIYRGVGHAFLDEVGILPQAEDSLIETSEAMTKYLG